MKPRNVELSLLIVAAIVTLGAYVLVSLGQEASLPVNIVPFFGIVLGLLFSGHFANRMLAPTADPLLLPLAVILNGMGYVMIARLDPKLADNQMAWIFVGLVAFTVTLLVFKDIRILERYRYTLALVGVILLLLPLIPGLGVEINGARIWLRAGAFSIQPGEFAKVALGAFLAGYLADKRELLSVSLRRIGPLNLPDFKYFGPLFLAWGVALIVMIAERDLGSSLLFFTLFVVMLYIATSRTAFVLSGVLLFGSGAYVSWRMFPHVQQRVDIWFDPFDDSKDAGFQVAEAAFAMADGGLTGTGLGLGTPWGIPEVATDMIFAAFGEELGLVGATAILAAFLLLVGAGFRVSFNAASEFERLFAAGLTALLGFQAFIIIGGVLRVLPLTGITLPFVSYGGSSLIANWVILAILIRISDRSGHVGSASDEPEPSIAAVG